MHSSKFLLGFFVRFVVRKTCLVNRLAVSIFAQSAQKKKVATKIPIFSKIPNGHSPSISLGAPLGAGMAADVGILAPFFRSHTIASVHRCGHFAIFVASISRKL